MQNDDANQCDARFEERAHLEQREGHVDLTLVIVKVLELAGENGFDERDDGDDDEEERRHLPWLFDVVVDVAEEDEADARADHDTVLEVIADCLVQGLVIG